MQICSQK